MASSSSDVNVDSQTGLFFMSLLLLAAGGIVLVMSAGNVRDYWQSRAWQTTDGTIVASEILDKPDGNRSVYRAHITYVFTVAEQQYSHDRVKFGDDLYTSDQESVRDFLADYPPEKAVTVYYDPNDPQQAIIERGLTRGSLSSFLAGIGLLLAGGGLLIGSKRKQGA